ncbi:hypothetical protein H1C71_032643 [Ictidomys tridecemlineatus]|nr:hypothetical protein H1C71_032643 [Ictidomys tridecemlineatus]
MGSARWCLAALSYGHPLPSSASSSAQGPGLSGLPTPPPGPRVDRREQCWPPPQVLVEQGPQDLPGSQLLQYKPPQGSLASSQHPPGCESTFSSRLASLEGCQEMGRTWEGVSVRRSCPGPGCCGALSRERPSLGLYFPRGNCKALGIDVLTESEITALGTCREAGGRASQTQVSLRVPCRHPERLSPDPPLSWGSSHLKGPPQGLLWGGGRSPSENGRCESKPAPCPGVSGDTWCGLGL